MSSLICQRCHNGILHYVNPDYEGDTYTRPMYCESCGKKTSYRKLAELAKFRNSRLVKAFTYVKGQVSLFKFAVRCLGFWKTLAVFTKREGTEK